MFRLLDLEIPPVPTGHAAVWGCVLASDLPVRPLFRLVLRRGFVGHRPAMLGIYEGCARSHNSDVCRRTVLQELQRM